MPCYRMMLALSMCQLFKTQTGWRAPSGLTPLRWTHFCHAASSSSSLTSSNSAGLNYPKAECLLRVL